MAKPGSDTHSRTGASDAIYDGLDNYDIVKKIGGGSTSVVHLAVGKRGRLRDRHVAIKKVPMAGSSNLATSISLHQSLHHPSVVSLLSAFSSDAAQYHVLEFCSRGTLSSFLSSRNPPILSESEIRGVLKSLVDALQYLQKERVIHRNIKASNIFISDNHRIKLGDFGLATRLPIITASTKTGSQPYFSPEIRSHRPHSFHTDVWSLGCLTIHCLSGSPPFEAGGVSEIFENASNADYALPRNTSPECRDLISRLLKVDPAHRLPLHSATSHPFFSPALPTTPLDPTSLINNTEQQISLPKRRELGSQSRTLKLPPFPPKVTFARDHRRNSDVSASSRRKVLGNVANRDLRHRLGDEILSSIGNSLVPSSMRRIVSDPLPRNLGRLATELPDCDTAPDSCVIDSPLVADSRVKKPLKSSVVGRVSSPPSNTYAKLNERFKISFSSEESNSSPVSQTKTVGLTPSSVTAGFRGPPVTFTDIPVGTSFPTQFTTRLLKPQTHKSVNGQLTILPSRSLLVDFREGERRRGKKGNEVFVVDPTGKEVKVYSAPHLSTPCCLAETVAVYPTNELPPQYWKSHNDARHLIEQIKQRTPTLVMYTEDAKCTLMSNAPQADIELLFQQNEPDPNRGTRNPPTQKASMRIRLSRQKHSVEIARYTPESWGGEWTKKVVHTTGNGVGIPRSDWCALQPLEKERIERLAKFLRACEVVEDLNVADASFEDANKVDQNNSLPQIQNTLTSVPKSTQAVSSVTLEDAQVNADTKPLYQSKSGMINSLRMVNVPPRPEKLPQKSTRPGSNTHLHATTEVLGRFQDELSTVGNLTANMQTRFIPSIGWCIRYGSKAPQGSRYRIMFLDGVTLDVDVDEEYLVFNDQSGNVSRHAIRDCNSKQKIWERMKVFEVFVSLFDCSSV